MKFLIVPVTLLLLLWTGCTRESVSEVPQRHVLFIAGAPSHGFGNHEHLGGSKLLAETVQEAGAGLTTRVVSGWPADPSHFDGVDAIVIYSNGGVHHPVLEHLEQFEELMAGGVGLVTLHYAVEVPVGEAGEAFLRWNGGYFETHWSVNPFWTASFDQFPDHPVTRGVEPFSIRDEWYYHMRFADDGAGVQPILTDLPPPESLERDDGPHSGNPHVREAVLERSEPQHVAWAAERPEGGRAFGFTGGHYHWNWGHDQFRRLVANAIIWSAGAEPPENGVPIRPVNVLELAALTDDPIPEEWDYREIQQRLDRANGRTTDLESLETSTY